ncbi:hypothetical protein ACFFV7_28680 [Nonomuraea spiralis]|uniref:Uncharacterized protein n=1 Tax=Nonomuraea spiralis TaxID=46182 RepID=A0ABV5IKZ7_9ACTN|nr:hypothetical protein [Nonomuraea spiralis]
MLGQQQHAKSQPVGHTPELFSLPNILLQQELQQSPISSPWIEQNRSQHRHTTFGVGVPGVVILGGGEAQTGPRLRVSPQDLQQLPTPRIRLIHRASS